MIECEHFYDPEAGMRAEGAHNARVAAEHDVNATFPTLEEVRVSMAATWNERHPDDQVPADGSTFNFTDVDPY